MTNLLVREKTNQREKKEGDTLAFKETDGTSRDMQGAGVRRELADEA